MTTTPPPVRDAEHDRLLAGWKAAESRANLLFFTGMGFGVALVLISIVIVMLVRGDLS